MNVCSYHLQEAGATPVQEIAFALATAIAVLDTVREASGELHRRNLFGEVVGRISFFVNAGLRFITELCKMRALAILWDEITARALRHHRSQAPAVPLWRAGQLARSDRAAAGEQHPADRARDAGRDARAKQRPRAGGAAAGVERGAGPCPAPPTSNGRCASNRFSRTRPIMLEYPDIFEGSDGDRKEGSWTSWQTALAKEELAIASTSTERARSKAVDSGYMKVATGRESNTRADRIGSRRGEADCRRRQRGTPKSEPSPLLHGDDDARDHGRSTRPMSEPSRSQNRRKEWRARRATRRPLMPR